MSPSSRESGSRRLPGISLERFATGLRADFRFAPVNVLLLVAIFVAGLILHLSLHPFSVIAVVLALGSALVLAILLRLTQVWEAAVIFGIGDALAIFLQLRPESEVLLATAVVALVVAPSVQIAYHGSVRSSCASAASRRCGNRDRS